MPNDSIHVVCCPGNGRVALNPEKVWCVRMSKSMTGVDAVNMIYDIFSEWSLRVVREGDINASRSSELWISDFKAFLDEGVDNRIDEGKREGK